MFFIQEPAQPQISPRPQHSPGPAAAGGHAGEGAIDMHNDDVMMTERDKNTLNMY